MISGSGRPGVDWAIDDLDIPAEPSYRGLEFYREEDAGLFFGRDSLTSDIITRLRTQSFLVVIGASGSGKSSLVRAGVMPALKRGEKLADGRSPPKGSAGWAYLTITPTEHPLERLAVALTSDQPGAADALTLAGELRAAADNLRPAIGKYLERAHAPRLFLLVDQFEEVFTACKNEDERRAFIDGLLAAAGGSVTVVLTLRADFYHRCDPYPALRAALEQHQIYTSAPDREELRAAIVEPATQHGYALEEGLADLMLREAGDEPGALPLLSHALLETWRRRDGRAMTLDGYNRAGGVRGAIAHTAEAVYGDLENQGRKAMERIFIELTELGEGAEDTRRRVSRVELFGHPWFRDEGERVLEQLVSARLATADGDAVQIAHEALIREWPRLREWLAADRQGERLRRDLAEAARDWEANGRDESYLIAGSRLATAREWAAANPGRLDERSAAFLAASAEREENEVREAEAARQRELDSAKALGAAEARRARITRQFLYVAGALTLLAIAAAIFALNRSGEARRQAVRAEDNLATAMVALIFVDQARETAEAEATRADLNLSETLIAQSTAIAALATSEAETARADRNAVEIQSRQLISEARMLEASRAMRAGLLSVHAGRLIETAEVVSAVNLYTGILARHVLNLTPEDGVFGAAWNGDESRLLTWGGDDTAVWDASSGEHILNLNHKGEIFGAAWNSDESRLLTWSSDGTAAVWVASSGEKFFAPRGDGTFVISDTTTGERLLSLSHEGRIFGAAWNSDESRILTWSDDGTTVWDAASGEHFFSLSHEGGVNGTTWNGDERRILTWSGDSTAIWDAESGERLLSLSHEGEVNGAVWDGDESLVLTWGGDGTAAIWDAMSGERIQGFQGDGTVVTYATWNADESQVSFTTVQGRVFRYYTRLNQLLAAACERITRNLTWNEWQLYLPGEPYRCACPNQPEHQSVLEAPDAIIDEATVCSIE